MPRKHMKLADSLIDVRAGAYVADMLEDDKQPYYNSVHIVLSGLELCIAHATAKGDLQSIASIQEVISSIFRRSAESIEWGTPYEISGGVD